MGVCLSCFTMANPNMTKMLLDSPPRCKKNDFFTHQLSQRVHMSHCAFFEHSPIETPLLGNAQRDGPPFGDLVLPFVDKACDQKAKPCKLSWDMQHEVVLRHEECVAVGNHMCCIVSGHGIC